MRCCFGGGANVERCHVAITAQLSLPHAAGEGSTRAGGRTSTASLHALPTSELGTDEGSPEDFTPPTSFPGLAHLVQGHLRAEAKARTVEVKRVSCAPAAGPAMLVCVTLVCDLTFAEKAADEWFLAPRGAPAVLRAESGILNALATKRVPGLATVNTVCISEAVKREDSVLRGANRPSQRRLRTSMNQGNIDDELAAAPPGTFNIADAPPPEQEASTNR